MLELEIHHNPCGEVGKDSRTDRGDYTTYHTKAKEDGWERKESQSNALSHSSAHVLFKCAVTLQTSAVDTRPAWIHPIVRNST